VPHVYKINKILNQFIVNATKCINKGVILTIFFFKVYVYLFTCNK